MRRHWIFKGLALLVLAPLFVAALSFVVMSLWNALLPSLFALPVIGFWQAAGLLVLCRILFGGFRGHGGRGWRHRAWRERWHGMNAEERERFRDGFRRWKHLSPEERREFRRDFHGCGAGADSGSQQPGARAAGARESSSRVPGARDPSDREPSGRESQES